MRYQTMPYIQIDTQKSYPVQVKQNLAEEIGDTFCRIMQARDGIVNVSFRACGEDSLFRVGNIKPQTVSIISCDIRKGRPALQHRAFAEAIVLLCERELGREEGGFIVYFTEHMGAEIYRDGVLSEDWDPDEQE